MINFPSSKGFAIALAWPGTQCKQAGAWYDKLMYRLGINQSGYYRVGHAAMVLIDQSGECSYFDFGRYHAPKGFGRVRSSVTDHDLRVKTKAAIDWDNGAILNIREILNELVGNKSTHGDGAIYGKETMVDYTKTLQLIHSLQRQEFINYGPFVAQGTNCSRFVNKAIRIGSASLIKRLMLRFPLMITPTPMWNLLALGGSWHKVEPSTRMVDKASIIDIKLEVA